MGTEKLLEEYLANSRATKERIENSEVVARIETIFEDLNLPWTRSDDNWTIQADVGPVVAGLDEDQEVLTIHQFIGDLVKPDKKRGEFYGALLRENMSTTGACFAIFTSSDGSESIVIVARIAAPTADNEEVALALESVFRLSALFDA